MSNEPRMLANIQMLGARTRAWMFCSVTSSRSHVSGRPMALLHHLDVALDLGVDVEHVVLGVAAFGDGGRGVQRDAARVAGALIGRQQEQPW
jgi:hypothetical protein